MQVIQAWRGINGQTTTYCPRLILTLIEHLPPDSATMIAISGQQYQGWTREAAILADIYDALNNNTIATGNWRKRPPKIAPYPRPGQKDKKRNFQTVSDLQKMFGG